MELSELVHNALAVGGIGHTEPLALGSEHLDLGCAVVHHLVDHSGDEELGLGLVDVLLEEVNKATLAVFKVVRREAPEVHRHGRVKRQVLRVTVLVGEGDVVVSVITDAGALDHAGEKSVAGLTHAACYGAALAHGVTHLEAYHAVVSLAVLGQR